MVLCESTCFLQLNKSQVGSPTISFLSKPKNQKMKKSLFVFYSLVCYGIFFITFLYAVGFVGNMIVPKSIDTGFGLLSLNAILINVCLLSVFALQHSVMARPKFKKWFTAIIPETIERSTYVLLSSFALVLIYWKWQPMTGIVWAVENQLGVQLLTGLFFIGWVIVLLSSFMINHFELFGLKQVYDHWRNHRPEETKFTTRYFYGFTRHPIMLGFLISIWATPVMTAGYLLIAVVISIYVFIAVKYLEERDLINALGEQYIQYKKEVSMIVHFIGTKG